MVGWWAAVLAGLGGGSASIALADVTLDEESRRVVVSGDIRKADVAKFRSAMTKADSIALDSPGGNIDAAMEMGRIARRLNVPVSVADDARCYSSCALIYISGVVRTNHGKVGVHRPFFSGPPASARQIEKELPQMLTDVRNFIAEMGVMEDFARVMINTPPSSMRVFVGDEILEYVPEIDPLYDELRVADEARTRGVTTDDFRRLEAKADRYCGRARNGTNDTCRAVVLSAPLEASVADIDLLARGKSIPEQPRSANAAPLTPAHP